MCSSAQSNEVKSNINGQWTQLSGTPELFQQPLKFLKPSTSSSNTIEVAQFTAAPRQKYRIRCTVVLPVMQLMLEVYDEVVVEVIPANLIVKIQGGNQMNPFSKPLDLYGDAYDPGVNGHSLSRAAISCMWICKNLNTGGNCFMANGDLLNLTMFTNKEVHVREKRLEPYISYVFQLICSKLDITN